MESTREEVGGTWLDPIHYSTQETPLVERSTVRDDILILYASGICLKCYRVL